MRFYYWPRPVFVRVGFFGGFFGLVALLLWGYLWLLYQLLRLMLVGSVVLVTGVAQYGKDHKWDKKVRRAYRRWKRSRV